MTLFPAPDLPDGPRPEDASVRGGPFDETGPGEPPDHDDEPERFERPDPTVGLNPVQLEAVTHVDGPLLVVAGAGSGKTRVLTHRIAHLIRDEGVSPFEILAITFTNKAADEMKQRVAALVGPVAQKMWVSTFHSACVRILRRDGKALGYPSSFTIYDQADAVRLTGYVVRDLNLDSKRFPPRSVHATISAAKNDGVGVDDYAARAQVIFERKIADVYREYQARLERAGAMDFDDLLANAVRLFKRAPRRARPLPAPLPARAGRRVPGHQPRPERARAPAHRRAPQRLRGGRLPTSACRPGRWCRPRAARRRIDEIEVGDEVLGTGGQGRGRRRVG